MKIEIDMSGRIEYTSHDTIIADSIGNYVFIKKQNKRHIQTIYRNIKRPQIFVLEVFSSLIALLIAQSFSKAHLYIIDSEYVGRSDEIKRLIIKYLNKLKCSSLVTQIQFGFVGKQSGAHQTAFYHYKNSYKAKQISLKKLLRLLEIKKGSRFL